MKKVGTLSGPDEHKNYLMTEMSPDILRLSREKAQEYLDESLGALKQAGLLTDALAEIPGQIMGQVMNRF